MNIRLGSTSRLMRAFGLAVVALSVPVLAASAFPGGGQSSVAAVRNATAKFHDLEAAKNAGYAEFYLCTDQAGAGAMGQHYVNIDLVLDPAIDPLRPEALVYEPKAGGGYRLVGVEYVTFQAAWAEAFGATTPTVLGMNLKPVGDPNRYGLPPFFQRHVWAWAPNPRGMYDDWNSRVSCGDNGDPA